MTRELEPLGRVLVVVGLATMVANHLESLVPQLALEEVCRHDTALYPP